MFKYCTGKTLVTSGGSTCSGKSGTVKRGKAYAKSAFLHVVLLLQKVMHEADKGGNSFREVEQYYGTILP